MRIVGGTFRGRQLVAPKGEKTRPSTDRLRESLFNILEHSKNGLTDRRVLDLFAGSGALGLEALSRGARFALFVETDAQARGAIRQNVEALGLTGCTRIFRRDALALGKLPANIGGAFDLVLMDPPYRLQEVDMVIGNLIDEGWLAPGATVVIERGDSKPPVENSALELVDERRYGDCYLFFYRLEGEACRT